MTAWHKPRLRHDELLEEIRERRTLGVLCSNQRIRAKTGPRLKDGGMVTALLAFFAGCSDRRRGKPESG